MAKPKQQLINTASDTSMVVLPFSVTTEVGELRLFLNVQKVARVVELAALSPLPASMKPFCGLYDMDGTPIPVLDLTHYFQGAGLGDAEATTTVRTQPPRRLLLCNTMEFNVGLIVDRTRKVHRQSSAQVLPPPGLVGQANNVFCAVVGDERGFSYMLDVESLLEKEGISLEKETAYESDNKQLLKGKRILFVDDSKYFQSLGRQLLEKFAAEVDVAGNGQEAFERLKQRPDAYDLVLTDIEMPVMSGIELAIAIRKSDLRALPIVFHSSISNTAMTEDLKAQGLGDYIVKFDEKHLIEMVLRSVA